MLAEETRVKDEVTDEICESCGRNMVIKWGRFGKFLACPGYPECKTTKPLLTGDRRSMSEMRQQYC